MSSLASSPRPVVFDLDGVLVDFNTPFRGLLERAGAVLRPFDASGEPDRWDWMEAYGASRAQVDEAWKLADDAWWRTLLLHRDTWSAGVQAWLTHLPYLLVTSRPHRAAVATRRWVEDYLEETDSPRTVLLIPSRKVHALVALEPKIIVEDRPQTLLEFAYAQETLSLPRCTKILVSRPYNTPYHPACQRAGIEIVPTTAAAILRVRELLTQKESK